MGWFIKRIMKDIDKDKENELPSFQLTLKE